MRRRNTVHRDVASEQRAVKVERAARRLLAGTAKVVKIVRGPDGRDTVEMAQGTLEDVPAELRKDVERAMGREVDG